MLKYPYWVCTLGYLTAVLRMNKNINKKNLIFISIIILILLVFIFGFYKNRNKEQSFITSTTNENPNTITYYCQGGIIKAIYGEKNVSLSLKNNRNITLPQTISGSGIRYESGITTFSSKGDNAFLMENNIQTYTNCIAGTETSYQDMNTYTNASKTFLFSYPNQFILSGGAIGFSQDWRTETTDLGLLLNVIYIPQSFLPNTNFGEAKFTVGTSIDLNAIKNCLTSDNRNMEVINKVIINSREFTKITFTGVGAGNYYDTTSYRTLYNNQCYAIEYTIHSTNIYNYSPDQGIKEFDKIKINSVLENIVQSFKFIQ